MFSLELGLLILESVLLVATITLLVVSIREGRARDTLLRGVERATKILTRHEYFFTVADSMLDAKEEIVGYITGRRPAGGDTKRVRGITDIIKRLTKNGVRVKYNMPNFQDRLYMGWVYTRAGAEVRYGSCQLLHDFRYTVVDRGLTIVGIPEATGQKEATKKGYRIPSEGLSSVLKKHFYECWEGSMSYEEYLRQTLRETGDDPGLLSRELGIDKEEIERIAKGET